MDMDFLTLLLLLSCLVPHALGDDTPPPLSGTAAVMAADPLLREVLSQPSLEAAADLLEVKVDDESLSGNDRARSLAGMTMCEGLSEQAVTDRDLIAAWLAAALSPDPDVRKAASNAELGENLYDSGQLPEPFRGFRRAWVIASTQPETGATPLSDVGQQLGTPPVVGPVVWILSDRLAQTVIGLSELGEIERVLTGVANSDQVSTTDRARARLALRLCSVLREMEVDNLDEIAPWLAAALSNDTDVQRAVAQVLMHRSVYDPKTLPEPFRDFRRAWIVGGTGVEPSPEPVTDALPSKLPVRDLGGIPSAESWETIGKVLPNGMQLTVVGDPLLDLAAVVHSVDAGSSVESPSEAGAAHLVEHLMFSGSPAYDEVEWWDLVMVAGRGDARAYTNHDSTWFVTRVVPEGLGKVLRMEADRFCHFQPTADRVALEQSIVSAEARLTGSRDSSTRRDIEKRDRIFGEHPYGRNVIGEIESVSGLTADAVMAFHDRVYTGSNLHLIIVGPHDPKSVVALVEDLYSDFPSGPSVPPPPPAALVDSSRVFVATRGPRQRMVGMVWPLDPGTPDGPCQAADGNCFRRFWATNVALNLLNTNGAQRLQNALSSESLMPVRVDVDTWRGLGGGYVSVTAQRHNMLGVAAWNTMWVTVSILSGIGSAVAAIATEGGVLIAPIKPPIRTNPTARRVRKILEQDDGSWIVAADIEETRDRIVFSEYEREWGADAQALAIKDLGRLGLANNFDVVGTIGTLEAKEVRSALLDILKQDGMVFRVW